MASTNHQFCLRLPDGWEDQTVHQFAGPLDRRVQHRLTLVIDCHPVALDVQSYARERIADLLEENPGLEVLLEEEIELPSGQPAYQLVCKVASVQGSVVYRKQVYLLWDGRGYTFVGDLAKRTMQTIGKQMLHIIDSLLTAKEDQD